MNEPEMPPKPNWQSEKSPSESMAKAVDSLIDEEKYKITGNVDKSRVSIHSESLAKSKRYKLDWLESETKDILRINTSIDGLGRISIVDAVKQPNINLQDMNQGSQLDRIRNWIRRDRD